MQSCRGALPTSRTLSTSSVRHTRRQAYRERCERPSPTVLSTSTSRARRPTACSTATEKKNSCSGWRPRPHRRPPGPVAADQRRTTPARRRHRRVRPQLKPRQPRRPRQHRPRCLRPRPQCRPEAQARHCRKAARVHRCQPAVPARRCRKAARAPRYLRVPPRRRPRPPRFPPPWRLHRRAALEPRCRRALPRRSLRRLLPLPPPPSWFPHRPPEMDRLPVPPAESGRHGVCQECELHHV